MTKVALVTGGSRGIGAAIAIALKEAGYAVAASYAGNDVKAAAFTAETGIKTYKWDVGSYDACKEGIANVEADLGPVDVLVNNAGITRDSMFHRMTPEQWARGYLNKPQWCVQHDPPNLARHARTRFWPCDHHFIHQWTKGASRTGKLCSF